MNTLLKLWLISFSLFNSALFPQEKLKDSSLGKGLTYPVLFQQFKYLSEKNSIKSSSVDSLTFQRQDAVFTLDKGTVYKCPPINNETHALLFIGSGYFSFAPPSYVEQMQLYRFYEKKSLNENFEFLFLLFSDSTFKELENKFTFSNTEANGEYKSRLKESMNYLFDESDHYIDETAAYIFLEGKNTDFFYSHFNDNNGDPMFYIVDPTEMEEIILMRRSNYRFDDIREPVCQYSSKKTNFEKSKEIQNGRIIISEYIIDSKIEDDLDFSSQAKINFIPSFNKQQWILLHLYAELEVDSVLLDGKKADFFKGEESSSIWILCNEPLTKQSNHSMTIYYGGDLLEKNDFGWISIKSPNNWFPRCMNRQKSIFDLTFHTPTKYKFCSVGKMLLNEEEEDYVTSRWLTDSPIRNASFNIGSFKEYKIEMEDLPVVTTYISEYGHNQIGQILAQYGELSGRDMEEDISADVINSFNLFKHVYGNIPLNEIYVTEIPYSHGEAFPGLIHLAWHAFQGLGRKGDLELFIAHEVAHQWWGIQVDFESYHDQWLSEAFAHYSGLWYMQLALKDNDRFFDELDNWKKEILNNRKYLLGSGQESGPIWLGYRTQGSETEGDYQLVIYEKGAWVLHMLRTMMVDLKTMNEDKFENMMSDFFKSYSGKKASTNDFQNMVEKHFGYDMDWFFNQWIYDTSIPDYKFAYKVTELDQKKYKVTCRVTQENVPKEFKMPVNLLIKFENDQFARLRVEVNGMKPEFDLPLLPLEPKEIIFNDLNSILCNVDYIKW